MEEITIDTLLKLCKQEVKKGNGKKKILVSDDEEGNSYHQIFFGFTPTKDPKWPTDFFTEAYLDKPYGVTDENINEFIILG